MGKRGSAEKLVAAALEAQSEPGDVLLTNVRFTDPKDGDVEADFLLLIPDFGVVAIEVKGGLVTYAEGEWRVNGVSDPTYSRRIHPIEQARRAKHALRRYLDRQPEWNLGLIRADWLVVFPETDIAGDLGPEGLRDHLIGSGDVLRLRERARRLLDSPGHGEPRPSAEQIQDAVSLLFRTGPGERPGESVAQNPAARSRRVPIFIGVGVAAAIAALVGLLFATQSEPSDAVACSPDYSPCIPIEEDLDCPTIRMQVEVIGEDVYGLDRDGNGLGCEMYGVPSE